MTRSTIYLKMSNSRFERWCIFQADMSVFTPAAFLAVWFRAVSRNVPKGVAALKVASAILDSRFGQSWGPGLPKTTAMPEAVDGSEIWLKPVDVDSRYPSIHRVLYTSQVVVWDFWTINSRTGILNLWLVNFPWCRLQQHVNYYILFITQATSDLTFPETNSFCAGKDGIPKGK